MHSQWEDYFKWQLVHRYLPFLGTDHLQAFQSFREATEGVAADSNRAATCVTSLQSVVPYTLARLYAKYILPNGTIPQMSGIVNTIKTAFNERLESTTWLDQQTINASIEKVQFDMLLFQPLGGLVQLHSNKKTPSFADPNA